MNENEIRSYTDAMKDEYGLGDYVGDFDEDIDMDDFDDLDDLEQHSEERDDNTVLCSTLLGMNW